MEINSHKSSDALNWCFWTNLNFDDEFAEPTIMFSLVNNIQYLRIDLENCLTVSNDLDQIVAQSSDHSDQTRLTRTACVYFAVFEMPSSFQVLHRQR